MAPPTLSPHRFSREERVGLAVAVLAHVALVAWLALEPLGKPVLAPPERMTVTFADEISLESTSPEPAAEAAPDTAPDRGETPPEPAPRVEPAPEPAVAAPLPRPSPVPIRAPSKPAVAKQPAKLTPPPRSTPAAKAPAKTRPADARARRRPDSPAGASRIGSDFLKGLPGGQAAGAAQNPPAAKAGPQVAASLSQAIARQLKPRWVAPQGAEAEQLVTVLAWDLNRDGTLAGRPRVVSQTGETEANRAQKARHAEQAIRAVQLAAPFDLPGQYYDSWKRVASFRFDRKLSQ